MFGIERAFILGLATAWWSTLVSSIWLHRALAHRSWAPGRLLTLVFHASTWCLTGIRPREWVAVHREHHRHVDGELDPHSPVVFGRTAVLLGNVLLYRRWLSMHRERVSGLSTDVPPLPLRLVDRIPWAKPAGLAVTTFGVAIWLRSWVAGGLWLGAHLVATALLAGSVNSLCHPRFGDGGRPLDRPLLALITWGEGWHGTHHSRPRLTRLRGFGRDPGWSVIRLATGLRLARDVADRTE